MAPKTQSHRASQDLSAPREADLVELYRRMVLMRRFEEKIGAVCERAAGAFAAHAGAEAVAAGAIAALSDSDYVVSTCWHPGHYLARGGDLAAAAAYLLGGEPDGAQRRGDQLIDRKHRFVGTPGQPAGGLGAAVELAMACAGRGEPAAVCCLFGDAALGEDEFGKTLRLVSERRLPIVFVCENNFCGLGTQFDGPDCQEALYRFAESCGVAAQRVDGAEVLEVYRAAARASACARSGGGPSLVDAVTYHLREAPDFDRAAAASLHHPGFWRDRDPLRIARNTVIAERRLPGHELDTIERRIEREITRAIVIAQRCAGAPRSEPARLRRDRE
jgi:TPP-dependent pyruvate/acetoin dehydrogenase alpha subunit